MFLRFWLASAEDGGGDGVEEDEDLEELLDDELIVCVCVVE